MADLVITAANVLAGSGARTKTGTAGEAVTAGQVVALASDRTYMLADDNSATAAIRSPKGIALHAAAAGQPLTIIERGPVNIGATLTPGIVYYLSDTPGGICPVADLAAGEYVSPLGIATSASTLALAIQESGVAL